jgi:hypothetical protein
MMKSIRPDLFPANDETVPEQQSKPSTNDRILKLLTKGQLEKWREITGLPIEGTIRFPSPFDFASPEPEGKAPAR